MTSRVEALRAEKVLQYLQGIEAGTGPISMDLGIPYPSARRILVRLEKDGKIKQVGYEHGKGGFTYTTIDTDPMINLVSFGNNVPATVLLGEFVERAKANNRRFSSQGVEDAVHYLAKSLATNFYAAHIINDTGRTDEDALRASRQTLLKCEKTFAEMARLCRQIIDEPALWEPRLLLQLTHSGYWNTRQIIEAYNIFTQEETA